MGIAQSVETFFQTMLNYFRRRAGANENERIQDHDYIEEVTWEEFNSWEEDIIELRPAHFQVLHPPPVFNNLAGRRVRRGRRRI